MASAFQYQQDWETKLAMRLDKPQNWKETCDVRYTDTQTLVLPYISTTNEPAVSTTYLATAADRADVTKVIPFISVTQSSETLQVLTGEVDNVYIDYADQAQSNYSHQMVLADILGKKIGERVEQAVLANHANFANIGDDGSGNVILGSTALTVSSTNIDDIIRGITEQIQTANGFSLSRDNGAFVVWRPADWTKLVAFMQANGYSFADQALQGGGNDMIGRQTMGLWHYISTLGATGHLMAGVRGVQILGLLKSTYGKIYTVENPASSTAGFLSGTSIYSRLDYGLKVQTNVAPLIFDVNVA